MLIAKYFAKFGTNWEKMAFFIKHRSGIMLKNRYYAHIRKRDLLTNLLDEVKEYEEDGKVLDDIVVSTQEQESEKSQHEEENFVEEAHNECVEQSDNTEEEPAVHTQASVPKEISTQTEQEKSSDDKEIAMLKAEIGQAKEDFILVYTELLKMKSRLGLY